MAYSPFDVSSLPDLADNINLEEELEKMNEKITGLEDVELNGNRGTIAGNVETSDKHNESDASVLDLSLDSIIERVESQHVTLDHASEAPTPSTGTQGKKRGHTETSSDPTGEGEEIDVDGDESAERAGKRRRIDTAGKSAEASHEKAAAAASDVAATLSAEEASTTSSSSSTAPTAVEEELELSWSWGDGVEEEETDTSLAPPKKVSPLMGEIVVVEDVELKEGEEKLAKELNGSLSRENPFELPIIIRQRRVARLRQRAEVHRHKIKQILASWDVASLKRP